MSTSGRVAQLYPQALGSLFVAFYDSQGYGGGILTLPHTEFLLISEVSECDNIEGIERAPE
jgi:hypothetical protein